MDKTSEPRERIVKSSLLQSYTYNDKDLTLSVVFRDGTSVDYFNIPPPVMSNVFDRPGSIGRRFVTQIVRGDYRHEKTS